MTNSELKALSYQIRRDVLDMTSRAGSSHVGSSFSMAEILAVLYGEVLRLDPTRPEWPERDRFILSKGHGCAGLYSALAQRGFFPPAWLDTFYLDGSKLVGHATAGIPGIEVSTGSLGHGLPIGLGMAMAAARRGEAHRVVVMLSDGECDEGTTWEAALLAGHQSLENLMVIVDYNKIQSLGRVSEVAELEPFAAKWSAFRWDVLEIDGHDIDAIRRATSSRGSKPVCVIAHTVKGKGVSFMEDRLLWHYRSPKGQELLDAVAELERSRE